MKFTNIVCCSVFMATACFGMEVEFLQTMANVPQADRSRGVSLDVVRRAILTAENFEKFLIAPAAVEKVFSKLSADAQKEIVQHCHPVFVFDNRQVVPQSIGQFFFLQACWEDRAGELERSFFVHMLGTFSVEDQAVLRKAILEGLLAPI